LTELTEYSDLLEAEAEETERAVVMVNTAKMAEATEMAAAVMTTAQKAAVDITDGKGGSKQHIGGNTGL
jgi:hypothetical protein